MPLRELLLLDELLRLIELLPEALLREALLETLLRELLLETLLREALPEVLLLRELLPEALLRFTELPLDTLPLREALLLLLLSLPRDT